MKTNGKPPYKILVSSVIICRFILADSDPPEGYLQKEHYITINDMHIQAVFDKFTSNDNVYLLSKDEYDKIFPERWNKPCVEVLNQYKRELKIMQINEEIRCLQRKKRKLQREDSK